MSASWVLAMILVAGGALTIEVSSYDKIGHLSYLVEGWDITTWYCGGSIRWNVDVDEVYVFVVVSGADLERL